MSLLMRAAVSCSLFNLHPFLRGRVARHQQEQVIRIAVPVIGGKGRARGPR